MPQNIIDRPATSAPLDAAAARRARIRAVAAGLVDRPRMGRRFHVPEGVPLEASARRRRHQPRRREPVAARGTARRPGARRLVAAAFLAIQGGLLAALLLAPAFRVHTVDISGDRLLSRDAVLAAARVPHSSLFIVDGQSIEARLARLPWVRTATVTAQLPSTLHIALTEWQPAVLYRHGRSSSLLAADGATLPLTASAAGAGSGLPVLLDYRAGAQHALTPGLAELLASAARRWPAVYGCSLDAFVLGSSNILSAWCSSGWQVVFGALDGSAAVAAVPQQLAVLAALGSRVDLVHPHVGYVDLENPAAPTVGGKPGEPAFLRAAIAGGALTTAPPDAGPALPPPAAALTPAAATPAASPTPAATPVQTPPPTPTPALFSLTPPPPTPHR